MSTFLNHVQHAPLLCDGAMGSLLFERTGRLSEQNHRMKRLTPTIPTWCGRFIQSICKQAQPSSPPIPCSQPRPPARPRPKRSRRAAQQGRCAAGERSHRPVSSTPARGRSLLCHRVYRSDSRRPRIAARSSGHLPPTNRSTRQYGHRCPLARDLHFSCPRQRRVRSGLQPVHTCSRRGPYGPASAR